MNDTLFKNDVIYIPFLNFYEDETNFAILSYPDKKPLSGPTVFTITGNLYKAIYKYNIKDAKKIFNGHLRGLCPKKLWNNYGLIKTTYEQLIKTQIKYRQCESGHDYMSIADIKKHFEIISFDH